MRSADKEKIQEAIERHLVSLRDELARLGVKDHTHYILGPNPDATYLKNGVLGYLTAILTPLVDEPGGTPIPSSEDDDRSDDDTQGLLISAD